MALGGHEEFVDKFRGAVYDFCLKNKEIGPLLFTTEAT